ncbi:unnamed protein product [Linum trigynum]|uniref:Uncharacterized protein n=1 Tax=Linum trigynum TaxID=586398 RepID=A0AAV2ERN6_9ROSI
MLSEYPITVSCGILISVERNDVVRTPHDIFPEIFQSEDVLQLLLADETLRQYHYHHVGMQRRPIPTHIRVDFLGSQISKTHFPLRAQIPLYVGCFPEEEELGEQGVVVVVEAVVTADSSWEGRPGATVGFCVVIGAVMKVKVGVVVVAVVGV